MTSLDYICDYCDRSFTRKYNLRTHIENCHLYSTGTCDVCEQSFASPSGLALHLSKGHNRFGEGYPECDYCGRIFRRKQNIVSHMLTVHVLQPLDIRCEQCDKSFTTIRNKKRHVHHIHNSKMSYLICDACKKVFKGKNALINHIQVHHNESNQLTSKCKLCDRAYTNARNLKRHVENFHGTKLEYKCGLCTKSYPSNHSLRRHTRMRHELKINQDSDDEDLIDCAHCEGRFESEKSLREHMKTAHSFKTFQNYCRMALLTKATMMKDKDLCCYVCFTKFTEVGSLEKHKLVCKAPIGTKSCEFCDKMFTETSSLDFHKKVFHSESDVTSTNQEMGFKCKLCSRSYNSDRSLKHHMKLKHTTDELAQCTICDKVCNNKYYLESHMKIVHSYNNLCKCEHCDKNFKSKRNLRRHVEFTHLGKRRYKCVECETLFKEKRSLRKHVRTKHGDSNRFPSCHICNKRFECAKSCKIHLKLIHSFNQVTHPCHLCPDSYEFYEDLACHIQTAHSSEKLILKCELCNIVLEGESAYDRHNALYHLNMQPKIKSKIFPRCILCMKDFSSRKTLKRHVKKFHQEFDVDELAAYGARRKISQTNCEECLRRFHDDFYNTIIENQSHDTNVFKCESCLTTYSKVEYLIQRHKYMNNQEDRMVFSELCTTEIGYQSDSNVEPESTTNEPSTSYADDDVIEIKTEPMSP